MQRDGEADGGVLDLRLAAMDALAASVKLVPYNWSAWLKLAACLEGSEEVQSSHPIRLSIAAQSGELIESRPVYQLEVMMDFLPPVFPSLFFYVHATLEIHAAGQNLHDTLDDLDVIFPGSSTIKGMRAMVHYHVRGRFTPLLGIDHSLVTY